MLEILWLAGDIWHESWPLRWATYLCLGLGLYVFITRSWVMMSQFWETKKTLSQDFKAVTSHQKTKPALSLTTNPASRLYAAYQLSAIKLPWQKIWQSTLGLSLALMCLVFSQTASWLFTLSIPFFIFATIALLIYLKSLDQRQKLVEQVPLFLQALSNSLQAGYTLPMALEFIADEIKSPLQQEVRTINQKLSLQISLSQALTDFAQKVQNPEIDFFVESTLIQIKTGGNLIKLFNKIAYLIEEKLKLKRDIRSFTSQGKMSGLLIAGLWPVSVLAFSWLSPTHTDVLFNTPGGQAMLVLSLILEVTGFFFIWKIISVKL